MVIMPIYGSKYRRSILLSAAFITSSTKNAVFNEPINVTEISWVNQRSFNKAVEIKVVTYMKPEFT